MPIKEYKLEKRVKFENLVWFFRTRLESRVLAATIFINIENKFWDSLESDESLYIKNQNNEDLDRYMNFIVIKRYILSRFNITVSYWIVCKYYLHSLKIAFLPLFALPAFYFFLESTFLIHSQFHLYIKHIKHILVSSNPSDRATCYFVYLFHSVGFSL